MYREEVHSWLNVFLSSLIIIITTMVSLWWPYLRHKSNHLLQKTYALWVLVPISTIIYNTHKSEYIHPHSCGQLNAAIYTMMSFCFCSFYYFSQSLLYKLDNQKIWWIILLVMWEWFLTIFYLYFYFFLINKLIGVSSRITVITYYEHNQNNNNLFSKTHVLFGYFAILGKQIFS